MKIKTRFNFNQLFSADARILKKHPKKLPRYTQKKFHELPKQPKQKNLCSKMWLLDHLYIKLGIKQGWTFF